MFGKWLEKILAKNWLIYSLAGVALFVSLLSATIDVDLGWRLRYGEYFGLTGQFIKTDSFSWTLPGYQWFDISWLFDLFMYYLFTSFGFFSLSLVAGMILLLCYYLSVKQFNLKLPGLFVALLLFILYLGPIVNPGLRPQLVALLGISSLTYLIYQIEKGDFKIALFFPIVIFLWTNLHGTFLLGLGMTLAYTGIKILELLLTKSVKGGKISKINLRYLFIAFITSIFVIFLQPEGINLLRQINQYFPTNRVRGVQEWEPLPWASPEWLLLFFWSIVMMILALKKRRTVFGLYQAFVTLLFAYFAFNSRRMTGPYFLATLPFFLTWWKNSSVDLASKTANIFFFFVLIAFLINGLLVRLPQVKFTNISWQDYCNLAPKCSWQAVQYLADNPLPEKSFTYYNFGGLTIWNNRQSKVFVDGRMDQWQKNGYSPFLDHQKILYEGDLELFEKYNFDGVYIPSNIRLFFYLKRQEAQGKWQTVFEDEKAAIFVKK